MTTPLNSLQLSRRAAFLAAATGALVQFVRVGAENETDSATILTRASERLAAVDTMHFTLDVEGVTWIDPTHSIELKTAEGDLARPDRVSVQFQVTLLGATTVSIRMITIGEQSWTTDLITGNWGEAPPEFGYNPTVLYDNQNGLGPVAGKLDDVSLEPDESIDDHECYRVKGTSPQAIIQTITAGTMAGDNVGVELWIDKETFDMRRARLTEADTQEKEHPATWTLNMSKFNEPVTIEDPT